MLSKKARSYTALDGREKGIAICPR
jgi:hypothetical protein